MLSRANCVSIHGSTREVHVTKLIGSTTGSPLTEHIKANSKRSNATQQQRLRSLFARKAQVGRLLGLKSPAHRCNSPGLLKKAHLARTRNHPTYPSVLVRYAWATRWRESPHGSGQGPACFQSLRQLRTASRLEHQQDALPTNLFCAKLDTGT